MLYYIFILLWRIIVGRDKVSSVLINKQIVSFETKKNRLLDVYPDLVTYEFGRELHLSGRVGGLLINCMSKPTSFSITLSSSLDDRTTQNGLSYILNSIGRHDTFFLYLNKIITLMKINFILLNLLHNTTCRVFPYIFPFS
jgi:hypothetical protein